MPFHTGHQIHIIALNIHEQIASHDLVQGGVIRWPLFMQRYNTYHSYMCKDGFDNNAHNLLIYTIIILVYLSYQWIYVGCCSTVDTQHSVFIVMRHFEALQLFLDVCECCLFFPLVTHSCFYYDLTSSARRSA